METKRNLMTIQTFVLTVGIMIGLSAQVFAQQPEQQPVREDFTKKELKSFVEANERVRQIKLESEQNIVQAIEEQGLTISRFNEILQAQQDPEKKAEASAEELDSFNSAAQVIMKVNQNTESKMEATIEDVGLDVDTYRDILISYHQSQKVQSKINEMVNDEAD